MLVCVYVSVYVRGFFHGGLVRHEDEVRAGQAEGQGRWAPSVSGVGHTAPPLHDCIPEAASCCFSLSLQQGHPGRVGEAGCLWRRVVCVDGREGAVQESQSMQTSHWTRSSTRPCLFGPTSEPLLSRVLWLHCLPRPTRLFCQCSLTSCQPGDPYKTGEVSAGPGVLT